MTDFRSLINESQANFKADYRKFSSGNRATIACIILVMPHRVDGEEFILIKT